MSPPKKGDPDRDDNPGRILRTTFPTSRHVEMLFDAVTAQLGERAYVMTAGGQHCLSLFVRDPQDPSWIVPWPAIELRLGAHAERRIIPLPGLPAAPPRPALPGAPPNLRGLQQADLRICDGPDSVEVYCGEDGRACEWLIGTHGRPRPRLLAPLEDGAGSAVERFAARVATLGIERQGPARVRLPVPLPSGPESTWGSARSKLRDALWAERVSTDTRWIAIDGIAGTVCGEGASCEQALAAFGEECRRAPPKLPAPSKEPELTPEMLEKIERGELMCIRGPDADLEWPKLQPGDVPLALVPLPPRPTAACPFGRWVALLGQTGEVRWAGKRRDEHGFTLIGGDLLGEIDLDALDAQLDAVDRCDASVQRLDEARDPSSPPLECVMVHYARSESDLRWRVASASGGQGFHPHALDGDQLRAQIVRQRWR